MAQKIKRSDIRLSILNRFDNKCSYCGCALCLKNLSVDHLIPKRRGSNQEKFNYNEVNDVNNFIPCCKSCNSSKGSMILEVWRKELELKINRLLEHSSTYRAAIKFNLVAPTNNPVIFYFEKFNNG